MKNLSVKVDTVVERNDESLYRDIESYNIDKEFNYALVVVWLSIKNTNRKDDEFKLIFTPKVHYVVPFVTEEAAEQYTGHLPKDYYPTLLLEVKNGKVVRPKKNKVISIYYKGNCDNSQLIALVFENNKLTHTLTDAPQNTDYDKFVETVCRDHYDSETTTVLYNDDNMGCNLTRRLKEKGVTDVLHPDMDKLLMTVPNARDYAASGFESLLSDLDGLTVCKTADRVFYRRKNNHVNDSRAICFLQYLWYMNKMDS